MKFLFAAVLAAIASVCAPATMSAQSNDAILQRLDKLEKENAALRDRVRHIESRKQIAAPVTERTRLDSVSATPKATTAYADASVPAYNTNPRGTAPSRWNGFYVGAYGGYTSGAFMPP